MKALVASLQANQNGAVANTGGGNNAESERMIAELQAKLAEKQSDLAHSLGRCCTCFFCFAHIIGVIEDSSLCIVFSKF